MTAPPTSPGDTFLLFHTLPYDFEEDLPLAVGPNVYLDSTPQDVLDAADSAITDYILPGYHIEGSPLNNCCLRSPAAEVRPPGLEPSHLFFLSITALRFHAPIGIKIAGQFELGQQDDPIKNQFLFELVSAWQPDSNARYSGKDVRVSAEITKRIMQVADHGYSRLMSAIVFFSQVTCGLSISFQMSYLALFAALEALFVPRGNYAKTLARRIANFLSQFDFPESLNDWLESRYRDRSNLVHGVQDVMPWTGIRIPNVEALGRLHEVTRLCVLGFMSLDDNRLASLSRNTGSQLQVELDSLSPATGRFLQGQRMWCV